MPDSTSQTSENSHLAITGWLICSLAALFYCYEFLLRIEPSVMVPELMSYFKVSAAGLGILSAFYYYAYTPLQIVVGMLIDYFGPKRILLLAIGSCAVGALLFALIPNIYVAALGRFFIGVGSAFAFVGVLKLAAMWLPARFFAIFVGITTSLGMLGAMIGDIEMTWVVQHYGWHMVLWVSVVIGTLLIPLFLFFVHERKQGHAKFKQLLVKDILYGFLSVIRQREVLMAGFIGCMLYMSLSVFAVMWGISFLHVIPSVPRITAAKLNSMIFLGWLIGSPFQGWLTDKVRSRRWPLILGSLLAAICISSILIFPGMNLHLFYAALFLFGFFSSVQIICFAVGRDCIPIKLTATTMAMINFFVMLGGMILQPSVGVLLQKVWGGELVGGTLQYSLNAYRGSLMIIPIGLCLAIVVAFFMKETYVER